MWANWRLRESWWSGVCVNIQVCVPIEIIDEAQCDSYTNRFQSTSGVPWVTSGIMAAVVNVALIVLASVVAGS